MAPTSGSIISPREHEIDQILAKIDRELKLVLWLTPQNLSEEQDAFLSGKKKNPTFEYLMPDHSLSALEKELGTLKFPQTIVGKLLQRKAEELTLRMEVCHSIGKPELSDLSAKLYGVPDERTLDEARAIVRDLPTTPADAPDGGPGLSARAVVQILKDVMAKYGLEGWDVRTTDTIVSGVVVSPNQRMVWIRRGAILELERLAPIITHEIETHVLTTANGAAQPLELFVTGFAGYLKTQEGLAAYNVTNQHPNVTRPQRFWARNAIAVDLARRKSFREVFEGIVALGFDERLAFGVTTKVKRGFTDTSIPGAFTKDYIYLAGRHAVSYYVEHGGSLMDLYLGKVNVDDVDSVKQLPWIVAPKYLPDFVRNRDITP